MSFIFLVTTALIEYVVAAVNAIKAPKVNALFIYSISSALAAGSSAGMVGSRG